jgi:hypothetical protein
MLIEFISGWAAPQSGATNPALMAFPRVLVLILLLLAGALVLFYGKSLYFANWKIALSSAPAVKQRAVEKPAKDPRLKMDAVAARRASREAFLRQHSESNFNVPPVSSKSPNTLSFSIEGTCVSIARISYLGENFTRRQEIGSKSQNCLILIRMCFLEAQPSGHI